MREDNFSITEEEKIIKSNRKKEKNASIKNMIIRILKFSKECGAIIEKIFQNHVKKKDGK